MTPAVTPTSSQLRWMKAIHDYWLVDQWYPSYRELMKIMGVTSTNACADMIARLEKYGWVETKPAKWAAGVRLTPLGISMLKDR